MEHLIDEASRKQLKERFEKEMKREVEIVAFLSDDVQSCPLCPATKQFLEELAELTDKIKIKQESLDSDLAKKFNVTKPPVVLIDPSKGYRIVYTGAPVGYEAAGFIETIILVSNDESKLSPESKEKLKQLDGERHIRIIVTPTCPYCPMQVLLANQVAIEAKGKVTSECVEATEFPEIANKYGVRAVPHNVINDKTSSVGVQPEEVFVQAVLEG